MSVPFLGRVYKQGTSVGVVIPSRIRRAMRIERGDYLAVSCLNDRTIVMELLRPEDLERVKPKVQFTGRELMAEE